MALFLFHGLDKAGALEVRKATRPVVELVSLPAMLWPG